MSEPLCLMAHHYVASRAPVLVEDTLIQQIKVMAGNSHASTSAWPSFSPWIGRYGLQTGCERRPLTVALSPWGLVSDQVNGEVELSPAHNSPTVVGWLARPSTVQTEGVPQPVSVIRCQRSVVPAYDTYVMLSCMFDSILT